MNLYPTGVDNLMGTRQDVPMTETETRRHYKVLGTTEDGDGCHCCGRTNLKVYVAMEPVEGGPVVLFGTTCAAKMEKVTVKEIRDEVKAVEAAAREAARQARQAAAAIEDAAFKAWVLETYGLAIDQTSDLWGKVEGKTPFQIRQEFNAR